MADEDVERVGLGEELIEKEEGGERLERLLGEVLELADRKIATQLSDDELARRRVAVKAVEKDAARPTRYVAELALTRKAESGDWSDDLDLVQIRFDGTNPYELLVQLRNHLEVAFGAWKGFAE